MEKATTPLFVWHPPYYLLPTWKRKNKKGAAAAATASNIEPNLNMEAITSQHRKEEEEEKTKFLHYDGWEEKTRGFLFKKIVFFFFLCSFEVFFSSLF